MLRRSNPWPAIVDLFAALMLLAFGGMMVLSVVKPPPPPPPPPCPEGTPMEDVLFQQERLKNKANKLEGVIRSKIPDLSTLRAYSSQPLLRVMLYRWEPTSQATALDSPEAPLLEGLQAVCAAVDSPPFTHAAEEQQVRITARSIHYTVRPEDAQLVDALILKVLSRGRLRLAQNGTISHGVTRSAVSFQVYLDLTEDGRKAATRDRRAGVQP
jgi:hypothetical protein